MFFLIAGVGHCGTQWLASFLERPDEGIVCWHEQKFRVVPYLKDLPSGWMAGLEYELSHGVDSQYDDYIEYIKAVQQDVAIVGDSHSWEPCVIPNLAARLPVDRIVFLVRNGIQNVHSLYYHNTHLRRDSWFYEVYLRSQAAVLELSWDDLDDWGKWCAWWATNAASPKFLADVAAVETVKFEKLLAEPEALIGLTKSLQKLARPTTREARQHAGYDMNRKIEGDRTPERLWQTWTDAQRETFKVICGPAMKEFGYEIPDLP